MSQHLWKHGLAPIIGKEPKLMILGSLPGEASLVQQQYYAHPRNQFWCLLGDCCGVDLQSLKYADKIGHLQQMPLILWDVIAKAKRQGSLDSAIQSPLVQDLHAVLQQYPHIEQIWFNGQKAAQLGQKALGKVPVRCVVLPSSSPAYTLPYAQKHQQWLQAWQQLFLIDEQGSL